MGRGPGSVYDKWSFETQIFHSGQPNHGGARTKFRSDDFNLSKRNSWYMYVYDKIMHKKKKKGKR